MDRIPKARVSPRFENGILFWYAGDTFSLELLLELRDHSGAAVSLRAEDRLVVQIRDERLDPVTEYVFTGSALEHPVLRLDETRSLLFRPGAYSYDVYLERGDRVTLANNNRIIVEE